MLISAAALLVVAERYAVISEIHAQIASKPGLNVSSLSPVELHGNPVDPQMQSSLLD